MLQPMIKKLKIVMLLIAGMVFSQASPSDALEIPETLIIDNVKSGNKFFYITNWKDIKLFEFKIVEGKRESQPSKVVSLHANKALIEKIKLIVFRKDSVLTGMQPKRMNELRSITYIREEAIHFTLNDQASSELNKLLNTILKKTHPDR